MIEAGIRAEPFPVYGDGHQTRDFTYVGDVVDACMAAAASDVEPATFANVSGGSQVDVDELLHIVGDVLGTPISIERHPAQPGDVRRTGGATERAAELFDWKPATALAEGIANQVNWHLVRHGQSG